MIVIFLVVVVFGYIIFIISFCSPVFSEDFLKVENDAVPT